MTKTKPMTEWDKARCKRCGKKYTVRGVCVCFYCFKLDDDGGYIELEPKETNQ